MLWSASPMQSRFPHPPARSAASFCCTGEDSDFLSMLDDLAANYPSVQLVSFSIDTRSFADTDGSAVTATAFNVSLNVILCDKGGVQP